MGPSRLLLGCICVCLFQVADGAALRQEIRNTTPNANLTEANSEQATMDLVLVHCSEKYFLQSGGDGRSRGFSPLVWDAGTAGTRNSILRVRRSFVYTKCKEPLRVGPAFQVVDMSYESPRSGQSFEREESGYIKHILDHYDDLADWTVFVHGYPEEHNDKLLAWLDAFKRQRPTSAVYVPINAFGFVHRMIDPGFVAKLGLKGEVSSVIDSDGHMVNGLPTATVCCAQFIVSSQAIKYRSRKFWSNIQGLFKRKEFKLLVQQTAMTMLKEEQLGVGDQIAIETRTNATNATVEPRKRESTRSATANAAAGDPLDNLEVMKEASVDREGSMAYRVFETVWHVLFGQPAVGDNVLTHSKKYLNRTRSYWCTWFEESKESPCALNGGPPKQTQCWGAQCGGEMKRANYQTLLNKSRETLLSERPCCGSR